MKNSHKCNFSVMGEWQKHHQKHHQRDGSFDTIKGTVLLMVFAMMHHQRDGSFDGVCYDVLSVRMLELIFVAYFCSFFCFFS